MSLFQASSVWLEDIEKISFPADQIFYDLFSVD